MSYPIGDNPDAGDCPETHPKKVVTLFHEWIFNVNLFEFNAGKKNWGEFLLPPYPITLLFSPFSLCEPSKSMVNSMYYSFFLLVFSFGDDVGYGFHADFVNGWKQGILEAAVKQCTGQLFNNVEGISLSPTLY